MKPTLVPMEETTSPTPQANQSIEILTRLTAQYRATFEQQAPEHWGVSLLKGGIYLIAVNAGLPYVLPAMLFTSNVALSYCLGASVYVAIGSVSVWSVRNYMAYLQLLDRSTAERSTEWGITIGAVILGVISALPGALVTLKYNPLWMLPISLFFDISTNTASLNQFFRKLYINQYLYSGKKELYKARELLIERLQYGLNDDAVVSNPTTQTIIKEMNHAIAIAHPKLKKKNTSPLLSNQTLYFVKNVVGLLLPLSWEIICIYLVYSDMTKLLSLNNYVAGFIALSTTFPAFFLEYQFAVAILSALYDLSSNLLSGVQSTNPALNANPKTTITLVVIGLCLVSGAFTSRAQIILDLLAQSALRDALLYLVCVGTSIFKMSATSMNLLDVENDVAAGLFSNPIYKRKLLFNKFEMVLETSKPATIAALIPLLDNPAEPDIAPENNTRQETCHNNALSFFSQRTPRLNLPLLATPYRARNIMNVTYSPLQSAEMPTRRPASDVPHKVLRRYTILSTQGQRPTAELENDGKEPNMQSAFQYGLN